MTNNEHHEGASQSPYRSSHSDITTKTQLSSKPEPRSHRGSSTLKPNNHSPIYKLIAPWTACEPQRVGVEVKGLMGLPNTKTVVARWYRRSWNSEEGNGCVGNRGGISRSWWQRWRKYKGWEQRQFYSEAERRNVRVRANWRNGGNEWDYALAHFNLHSWPHVPTHPNSIDSLWIYVPFLTFFFFFNFSFNYENYYKKSQYGVVLIT